MQKVVVSPPKPKPTPPSLPTSPVVADRPKAKFVVDDAKPVVYETLAKSTPVKTFTSAPTPKTKNVAPPSFFAENVDAKLPTQKAIAFSPTLPVSVPISEMFVYFILI